MLGGRPLSGHGCALGESGCLLCKKSTGKWPREDPGADALNSAQKRTGTASSGAHSGSAWLLQEFKKNVTSFELSHCFCEKCWAALALSECPHVNKGTGAKSLGLGRGFYLGHHRSLDRSITLYVYLQNRVCDFSWVCVFSEQQVYGFHSISRESMTLLSKPHLLLLGALAFHRTWVLER